MSNELEHLYKAFLDMHKPPEGRKWPKWFDPTKGKEPFWHIGERKSNDKRETSI